MKEYVKRLNGKKPLKSFVYEIYSILYLLIVTAVTMDARLNTYFTKSSLFIHVDG